MKSKKGEHPYQGYKNEVWDKKGKPKNRKEYLDSLGEETMKSKREKKEEPWEKEFDDIQEEWRKCKTMNTCSICDSPKGHTTIKDFISQELAKAEQKGYERGKKENIMLIDKKITRHFNRNLKDKNSELIKMIQEAERKKVIKILNNEVLELIDHQHTQYEIGMLRGVQRAIFRIESSKLNKSK